MSTPSTAREVLIAEVLGEAGRLLNDLESQRRRMDASCDQLAQASSQLQAALVDLEQRMLALSDAAKTRVAQHIAQYTAESTRRAIDQQSRAMAEAAQIAFGKEFGVTVQRLQLAVNQLITRRARHWERWLTHAATAAVTSAATLMLTITLWSR